jgi:uncharacterized protein (TIGR02145 family)
VVYDDRTSIYYAAAVNLQAVAGTYSTTITYTATGEFIPCAWNPDISFDSEDCKEPIYLAKVVADNHITTLQTLTTDLCQSADYDSTNKGINDNNTVTLNDPRGNGQDYKIRKLADGNCWMIDNLKLKLTDGMTLTSATTNVATDTTVDFAWGGFTYTNGSSITAAHDVDNFVTGGYLTKTGADTSTSYNYDAWRQVDPSSLAYCINPTGGAFATTGSLTGCGYLYNYFTATAGSYPQSAYDSSKSNQNAPYSICPANWRLPSGRDADGDFGFLDKAYPPGTGAYHDGSANMITQNLWLPTVSFAGVFSGYYNSGFDYQGSYGYFWSSSVFNATYAYNLSFNSSYVYPGTSSNYRYYGRAVRCVVGL